MKNEDKAKEIASKWWQDLIKKENCNSTEEAIEKACLEMAEYKDKMFESAINWIKEKFIGYYLVDPKKVDDFLDIDGRLEKAYLGEVRTATEEEKKEIQEIMGERYKEYPNLWCFWIGSELYVKNPRDWWATLAGRLWKVDLEKRTFDCIMLS